ncbi:hypothetical protein C2W62_23905 [Candidatus Entotheonella serta]|nr:hypothetical protein C2W62_23905 [Candidatus Entotheonella serta]
MPVDPQVQTILDALQEAGGSKFVEMSAVDARAWFNAFRRPFDVPIGTVENRAIPGPGGNIPVRIFTPLNTTSDILPVMVYFHGGGWVVGDLDSHDVVCRSLANASGCKVVSVDNRLAPEHPWPASPDDCFAAVEWVATHAQELGVDANRLAVGGDSAGGNLATAATLRARAANGPRIAFQLLIYPAVDATMSLPSNESNGQGYFLEKVGMDWFYGHYLKNPADAKNPDVSPLFADDFTGLPPAYVVTAEYDPLRDEGRAYVEKLEAAGVAVEYINYPTMIHGFFGFQAVVDVSGEAVRLAGEPVAKALG